MKKFHLIYSQAVGSEHINILFNKDLEITPMSNLSWINLLQRASRERYLMLPAAMALLKGFWYKLIYKLTLKNIQIGPAFRVYGRLVIRGPGKIIIGSNCYVDGLTIRPVSLNATLPRSVIEIGNNCGFNGTVLQCYDRITIRNWSNIADAYIVDSPAHSVAKNRRQLCALDMPTMPVEIQENVWISTNTVILHGVTIGENSVIGASTLIRHNVPPNVLVAGNPAQIIKKIPDE